MYRFFSALRFRRREPRFVWQPAIDLRDGRIAATLLTFSGN